MPPSTQAAQPNPSAVPLSTQPQRVLVLGATGTIGRATGRALLQRGHSVVCLVRSQAGVGGKLAAGDSARLLAGATLRFGDTTDPHSLARDGFNGEHFDVLLPGLTHRCAKRRLGD